MLFLSCNAFGENTLGYGQPCTWQLSSQQHLTLHYFPIRGRAEIIRLLLEDQNISYNEIHYDQDEWARIKRSGRFAFQVVQPPC